MSFRNVLDITHKYHHNNQITVECSKNGKILWLYL
nr:MAG TPA: hypothetical protein [Caudoviricetes sp.]